MTTSIAIACGEVAWERDILAELGRHDDLEVTRRYVDVAGIERDLPAGRLPPVIIMSPALRGFVEKSVHSVSTATHVVVLVDSIRPPWLATSALDCREVLGLDVRAFVDGLAALAQVPGPGPTQPDAGGGAITLFTGVSGGVGTTSLAHLHARSVAGALLVEADTTHPSLAFLLGRTGSASGLADAIAAGVDAEEFARLAGAERALAMSPGEATDLVPADLLRLVDHVSRSGAEVVVDAGSDPLLIDALADRCDRLVLVTAATPIGVVRACSLGPRLVRPAGGVAIIANRARDSAIGGTRWMNAVRDIVERETGIDPVFVADDVPGFDRAWLTGDWRPLDGAVPHLMFTQS